MHNCNKCSIKNMHFFQISKHVIKSDLSLYWSVAVWEIWGNPITGHMWVTLYTVQSKWWLQGCESVTKCSVWYKQLYLVEKVKSHIYPIIIYSWHKVTCLLLVIGFPQISYTVTYQLSGGKRDLILIRLHWHHLPNGSMQNTLCYLGGVGLGNPEIFPSINFF